MTRRPRGWSRGPLRVLKRSSARTEISETFSLAPQREPQGGADLLHPFGAQSRDTFTKTLLRDRNSIMKIYRASVFHPVVLIQDHLRRNASDSGSDRSHGYSRKMTDCTFAR